MRNDGTSGTNTTTEEVDESTTSQSTTPETNTTTEEVEESTNNESTTPEESSSNSSSSSDEWTTEVESTTQLEDTSSTIEENSSSSSSDISSTEPESTTQPEDTSATTGSKPVKDDDEDFDGVCEKEEEQVTDEVDFNSPEWSKKVDLKDIFSTVCERTTNATTPTYLNTTASETEEEEQVTDEVDFNSAEWSKKVDLEDIFNTVCERTYSPLEHVAQSTIIGFFLFRARNRVYGLL
ncbi:hypothetical protein SprV_0401437500 [Sparganum proliferum]